LVVETFDNDIVDVKDINKRTQVEGGHIKRMQAAVYMPSASGVKTVSLAHQIEIEFELLGSISVQQICKKKETRK
jgi:hypothetical protein